MNRDHDVVDAAVVDLAIARRAEVVTCDVDHISKLAAAAGAHIRVIRP